MGARARTVNGRARRHKSEQPKHETGKKTNRGLHEVARTNARLGDEREKNIQKQEEDSLLPEPDHEAPETEENEDTAP